MRAIAVVFLVTAGAVGCFWTLVDVLVPAVVLPGWYVLASFLALLAGLALREVPTWRRVKGASEALRREREGVYDQLYPDSSTRVRRRAR
jgi:hypothetical protein